MADTVGSLADKISIIELKIFHMRKQVERPEATEEHRKRCADRLVILNEQRDDLVEEMDALAADVIAGRRTMKIYRQFKMYNDPAYRAAKPPR